MEAPWRLAEQAWRLLESLGGVLGTLGAVLEASWELLRVSWRRLRVVLEAPGAENKRPRPPLARRGPGQATPSDYRYGGGAPP